MRTLQAKMVGALVACSAVIAIGGALALASPGQPGSLDTSFGTGGTATVNFGGTSEQFAAVAVQGDGKIIAVGTSYQGTTTGEDFVVARLNADGSPDVGFGSAGKVTIDLGSKRDEATGVALQSDGKIVVAGVTGLGAHAMGVVRLTATGTLDTTFNSTGKATVGPGSSNQNVVRVAVQPIDQKIVLAGAGPTSSTTGFQVSRLTTTGQPDTTFNGTGTAYVVVAGASNGYSVATGLAVQNDGNIVVGGYGNAASATPFDVQAARLTTLGVLDVTFNSAGAHPGAQDINFGQDAQANALTLQPADGKLLLAGETGTSNGCTGGMHTALVRLNTDGTPDNGFGAAGKATVTFPSASYDCANGVKVDSNGKILFGGIAYLSGDGHVDAGRLNSDGTLDQAYGDPGTSQFGLGTAGDVAAIAGKFVLSGGLGSLSGSFTAGVVQVNDGAGGTSTTSATTSSTTSSTSASGTSGGTTSSGGAGDDLSVQFVSPPTQRQLGSDIPFEIKVTNSGPSHSSATRLVLGTASGGGPAGNAYTSFGTRGAPPPPTAPIPELMAPSGAVDVPALGPGQSAHYTISALARRDLFAPELGAARFAAVILGDGDATDDNPGYRQAGLATIPTWRPTGDDLAVTTTQIVIDGESAASLPCALAQRANATSARCTIGHGRIRSFGGRASGNVTQVQIAIESIGKGGVAARARPPCQALAGTSGRLQPSAATSGVCTQLRWLVAKGIAHWRYRLRRSLPPGHYVLYTRPVTPIGTPVAGFTAAMHNRLPFTVR